MDGGGEGRGVRHEHRWRTGRGGGGGLQRYGPTGLNGLQVLIVVRGRLRAGAGTLGKAIGWNTPPRGERSTM